MSQSRRILAATLLVTAAAGVVILMVRTSKTRRVSSQVVDDIESEFRDLDPLTKVAVVAKLSSDAVKDIRSHRS